MGLKHNYVQAVQCDVFVKEVHLNKTYKVSRQISKKINANELIN